MDKRTFWSTKNPAPQWETITFTHPDFAAPIRLVANVFATITLGGNAFTPAPMTISPPERNIDAQPTLRLTFPRQVVGRQFKQQLAAIRAAGARDPITVLYGLWLGETDLPKVAWTLFASDRGGIVFSAEAVQVTATLDNPMRRYVAPIYDPAVFTGLSTL